MVAGLLALRNYVLYIFPASPGSCCSLYFSMPAYPQLQKLGIYLVAPEAHDTAIVRSEPQLYMNIISSLIKQAPNLEVLQYQPLSGPLPARTSLSSTRPEPPLVSS